MKSSNSKSKSTSTGKSTAKEKEKAKDVQKSVANPRLVAAFKQLEDAKNIYQSYLVAVADIVAEEQCTKTEVVLSMMEAKGISKQTAEQQYSRMSKILRDEDTLQDLRDGKIDLKTARERTVKKQTAPNKDKQKEAVEKRFATSLKKLLEAAKEGGYDLASLIASVKANAKKEGIR